MDYYKLGLNFLLKLFLSFLLLICILPTWKKISLVKNFVKQKYLTNLMKIWSYNVYSNIQLDPCTLLLLIVDSFALHFFNENISIF